MRTPPTLYSWFLHEGLLDALLSGTEPGWRTRVRRIRTRHDQNACTRELGRWLGQHEVPSLQAALLRGAPPVGTLLWTELPFQWSNVAIERMSAARGCPARSSFEACLPVDDGRQVLVHGTFNPARLTCSTANSELQGVRAQYLLGHVAGHGRDRLELRPVAIAARLLEPTGYHAEDGDWQRVFPDQVDQFASVDWTQHVSPTQLEALRAIPERQIKRILAELLDEPTIPNDWGGETCDLYTDRLRVDGRPCAAAFVLKGPATFAPMTVRLLGANGDQLLRLATTPAQLLVLQHCHVIRPEVISLLRSLASDMRHVRRYMVLDGYDTYRLLVGIGYLQQA